MAEQPGLVVVIAGATGAVGRDIGKVLAKAPFPIEEVRAVASKRSVDTEVEVAGKSVSVVAMGPRGAQDPVFREADVVFFAMPPAMNRALAPAVASQGPAVIEIGGALANRVPPSVPALGLEELERVPGLFCLPSPVVLALATVLTPLRALNLRAAGGTVLLSAGMYGQAGTEELSAQVVALLNSQRPPRKVFPSGLAFDLHTPAGELGPEGWTAGETRIADELAPLLQLEPSALAFTEVQASLFAGIGVSLWARFENDVSAEDLRAVLGEASGLSFGDPVPGPRRTVGRSAVFAGRLRMDQDGQGAHLWVTADNLRACATGPALSVASALWRQGRFKRGPA